MCDERGNPTGDTPAVYVGGWVGADFVTIFVILFIWGFTGVRVFSIGPSDYNGGSRRRRRRYEG